MYAAKIDGRTDSGLYLQILKDELLNSLQYHGLNPPGIIFQQDNDPKHTSKKVKEWLEEHDFRTMVWPAQSPDLNPIELLWDYLKRRLAEHENPLNGIHELWERVQVDWEKIAASECQNLLKACLEGFRQCLRQKGGTQNTNTLSIFAYYQILKNPCNKLTNLKGPYLHTCSFKSYE